MEGRAMGGEGEASIQRGGGKHVTQFQALMAVLVDRTVGRRITSDLSSLAWA